MTVVLGAFETHTICPICESFILLNQFRYIAQCAEYDVLYCSCGAYIAQSDYGGVVKTGVVNKRTGVS
jgi:hypothetical protein